MTRLKSQLESLLFISAKPLSLPQLADLLEVEVSAVETAGAELAQEYQTEQRGLQIIKQGKKLQMVSAAANARLAQKFIQDEIKGELSRPSLETLTIIAYRGPINKISLDCLRGINCAQILRNLLLRGLIENEYNQQKKDYFYSVSLDFIRFLGISQVSELPDYEQLHNDPGIDKVLNQAEIC